MFKKAIDQYIQDTIFQIWHNLCSELMSMRIFKMYSRNTKTTIPNRPPVIANQTCEHLGHLKDLELSKYMQNNFFADDFGKQLHITCRTSVH